MIQVDGLSHTQLQRALEREHYHLHRQYAGVPTTTAAFRGGSSTG